MATPRELKKRIGAVSNTRKITRTMEMVSTAKSKKAVDRVNASKPYADRISRMISSISAMEIKISHPLLRKPAAIYTVKMLVITSNRGLCGGFNNNVIKLAILRMKEYESNGAKVELHIIGKKALSVFKFQKITVFKSYPEITDNPSFAEIKIIADYFMDQFSAELTDKVEIISTHYLSAAQQRPEVKPVLPITVEADQNQESDNLVAIFEPDPASILRELIPAALRMKVFGAILESAASEHIARRIAMKNATDAASDMIKTLTRKYNRVRQSKITQEIAEIVAGADALG